MAPGRKRGAKGAKTRSELSLGDLVLAKVKGYAAWPAKISRPEDWKLEPDPKKYFVLFFGTAEIAFVAPADIQAFTSETKNKLSARCQGKTAGYFAQAVKEISEEFDVLQRKKLSCTRDDSNVENLASETHSADPVEEKASEVEAEDEIDGEKPKCKLETNGLSDQGSRFGHSETKTEMKDVKPCSSDDIDHSPPPYIFPRKSKIPAKPSNRKDSVSGSTPSRNASLKDGSRKVKAEGGCSVGGWNELTDSLKPKPSKEPKRKHEELLSNGGSIKSPENTGDGMQIKYASCGNMNMSSADNSRSVPDMGCGRKVKRLLKEKNHSMAADGQLDILGEHNEVNRSKKIKLKKDHGKLTFRPIDTLSPAKISESADMVDGAKMLRAQTSMKTEHIRSVELDAKVDKTVSKLLASGGEVENHQPSTGNPNKVQSSGMQLPKKRRAVRICDDDDLPKTPVHGGVPQSQKISAKSPTSELKKKTVKRDEGYAKDQSALRNSGIIDYALQKRTLSSRLPKKTSSPAAEKRTREASAEYLSPNQRKMESEKLSFVEVKSTVGSPLSVNAVKPLAEPQNKLLSEASIIISQKKILSGASMGICTASDGSSLERPTIERNSSTSPGLKRKITPLSDSQINDPILLVRNQDENVTALSERMNVGTNTKTGLSVNSKISESVTSMKHLIAAAQARKKQAHSQNSYLNNVQLMFPDPDVLGVSLSSNQGTLLVELNKTPHFDVERPHPNPPSSDCQFSSVNEHEKNDLQERGVSPGPQVTGSSLSGDTEAAVVRDAFEGMIETLSRTKESIGRATRLAIDCAKYGIANEVVELLIHKLETESSFPRRVELLFLIDSITQCSHSQKGIAGASYLPIIQAALPRLISAAAPPGTGAHENRRQCHKVLRLWLERKIFPESAICRHMDDIGAMNGKTSTVLSQRRPSQAERAFDDPIRDMEGMLVDEYGSNATFQLSGLLLSHFFDEAEEDEDDIGRGHKEVPATSPYECTTASRDLENGTVTPSDRRHCVLEDVDGELEMEDVSAQPRDEGLFSRNSNSDGLFPSVSSASEFLPSPEGSPPRPPGSPPLTPSLPTSPPPPGPPSSPQLPPPPPSSPPQQPPPPSSDQHHFPTLPPMGPPPPPVGPSLFTYNQSLPPPPAMMPQHMPPLPSAISSSQPLTYHRPPMSHDISCGPTVNQHVHVVSNSNGPHIHAPVRFEVLSQQPSFVPPAAVSNVGEYAGYNPVQPLEYGKSDGGYLNTLASQQGQLFQPGTATFAQRPHHERPHNEPISQQVPSGFTYPNTGPHQNLYPPYPTQRFLDGINRNATDGHWRMQVNEFNPHGPVRAWTTGGRPCSGQPYSHEGANLPLSHAWCPDDPQQTRCFCCQLEANIRVL